MTPITRLWLKILAAIVEIIFIMIAAMSVGGSLPNWLGAIALTVLLATRMFIITGGIGGYLSYRQRIKEANRGEPHYRRS